MNVLWITNILFPEAISFIIGSEPKHNGSGGWLISSAESLTKENGINLVVAAPSPLVKQLTRVSGNRSTYYALPCKNEREYNPSFEQVWREIVEREQIDLVHVHGTEFAHGLAFYRAKINVPSVLSIQGLSEQIGYHYLDGMSSWDVIKNLSIFDLLYAGTPFQQKKRYINHGIQIEREMIKSATHIIGRTTFDYSHTRMLNSNAIYYKCNESLRDVFYELPKWNYEECDKHSIFLCQCEYPVKGIHQVLKAMPYVIRKFPDAQIRIAGHDIFSKKTLKQKMMQSTYANYLRHLIRQLKLYGRVHFTGSLDSLQMKKEYLKCNVFISPSSMENSSNSLGEAQILGVPVIASFVGGTPDMIPNSNCGTLYRFSDYVMLAEAICHMFDFRWSSLEECRMATERHDRGINQQTLVSIYESIID